jgi:hypothetical protein
MDGRPPDRVADERPAGRNVAGIDRRHHPLGVIAGVFFVLRRRRRQPLALLAAAAGLRRPPRPDQITTWHM